MANLNKKIKQMIENRPKYNIQPQYQQNQILAEGQAFGKNRALEQQANQVDQDVASGINTAQNYSSSSSSLLNTLSSIIGQGTRSKQDLGIAQAGFNQQGVNTLMGANVAAAEEADKAWNYNVNEPYQNQLNALVQRKKNKQNTINGIINSVTGLGLAAATGGFGNKPLFANNSESGVG